ncbi:hybrid sensor histidine kinase/response regulator [Rhizobium rhizogenes]|uniref:hybrid sensor histidine kinase/response regulator n=1 Tax=Rhizobium rhizogenes TaxID=359 RepID=UPI001573346C|nr:hybrid sensor histidine kinase/response regulator [Rhizobium rhizogenes]NTF65777.1 hybrid sensor histidine kinase/response regulator [Rhizobium rhizogenes]NTG97130.1 hybrid sensor histidine kinase/response regulator [Rhizobium rhizogenes]
MKVSHLACFGIAASIIAVASAVMMAWNAFEVNYLPSNAMGKDDPFYSYWPLSQAQRGALILETDMRLIAAGAPVDRDTVSLNIDVLISSLNIVVRPSKLNDLYVEIPEIAAVLPSLRDLATEILPPLNGDVSRTTAKDLTSKLAEANDTLLKLSNMIRSRDGLQKDKAAREIRNAAKIITVAVAMLIFVLVLLLVLAIRYRARVLREAKAVAAEEAAVKEKIEFLAMISHELRTPLQSIVSALELLEHPQEVASRDQLTKRIRRAANSLTVQLRDILTLARSKNGYIEAQPRIFDAVELVKEVAADYRTTAESKELKFSLVIQDEAIFVSADGERLAQILHNLISNAVKYTQEGTVRVELCPFRPEDMQVNFLISDTGSGLPQRTLEGDSQVKGLYSLGNGRGIGLSVVQTLLVQLAARVTIRSNKPKGSLFELTVPVVPVDDLQRQNSRMASRHILLVGEQPGVLEAFAAVFRSDGYVPDIAGSGIMALNFAAAHSYAAIFIDLDMPVMTASGLSAQIKKLYPKKRMKLIGLSMTIDRSENGDSNFDMILTKPTNHQLLAVMRP